MEINNILDSENYEDKKLPNAGFWWRFLALVIDTIILRFVSFIITFLSIVDLSTNTYNWSSDGFSIAKVSAAFSFSIIFQWLYYALFESSAYQGTIGKKILGIKVIDMNGNRISFVKASVRYFSKLLSALIIGIGFLMAGFTVRKQALHDFIADTLVVKKPEESF